MAIGGNNPTAQRDVGTDPAGVLPLTVASLLGLEARVYEQMKIIARARLAGERAGHTLQTTALVNEALLKLTREGQIKLEDRPGFFRAAAAAMRQILIDHARSAGRLKRGGGAKRVDLEQADLGDSTATPPDELLAIDEALKKLEAHDARSAEVVQLRFFAGLNMPEIAELTGDSLRSVERRWTYARAWLWRELGEIDA